MMGRIITFAVLIVCLGALGLFAEARSHEKFSASSYYDSNEPVSDVIAPKDEKTTEATTGDPNSRYPHGHYPGQSHVWNPATQEYETVNETDADPNMRYPHGHYPGQSHVWNPVTEKYESVNDTDTDPNMRYPHGHYPGQSHVWNPATEEYESVNETETDPNMRYPHGHYPGQSHVWNPETEEYDTVNETDTNSNMRYPHGHYPGQSHVWNPVTEKYESVNETDTDPNMRYPHGHYPGQSHVWNPATEKYETVNETDTDPNMRYPHGHYPNQFHVWNPETEKYEDVNQTGPDSEGNPSKGRYERGYYGQAPTNCSEGDTVEVVKSHGPVAESERTKTTTVDGAPNRYTAGYYYNGHSANPTTTNQKYSPENDAWPDAETFDPVEGRYKDGYFRTDDPKATGSKTFMSLTAQDSTTETDVPGERYRYGYYGQNAPVSTSSTSKLKPVTYSSYIGNFETLPYPGSRVTYVPDGEGCRTAYWAENTASWPAFLKVTLTIGDVFGSEASKLYGDTTILEALLEYSSDPFKQIARTGCTSLLNSYTRGRFELTPIQVIEEFTTALVSKEAATEQALVFETANVESISGGNACT